MQPLAARTKPAAFDTVATENGLDIAAVFRMTDRQIIDTRRDLLQYEVEDGSGFEIAQILIQLVRGECLD